MVTRLVGFDDSLSLLVQLVSNWKLWELVGEQVVVEPSDFTDFISGVNICVRFAHAIACRFSSMNCA
jgi:hypothetical protein